MIIKIHVFCADKLYHQLFAFLFMLFKFMYYLINDACNSVTNALANAHPHFCTARDGSTVALSQKWIPSGRMCTLSHLSVVYMEPFSSELTF